MTNAENQFVARDRTSGEVLWWEKAQSDFVYIPRSAFDITKVTGKNSSLRLFLRV